MFGIGLGEILLVLFITFLISPKDLPRVLRKIGQLFGLLSRVEEDLREIRRDVEDTLHEVEAGAERRDRSELAREDGVPAPEGQAGVEEKEAVASPVEEEPGPTAGPSA